MVTTVRTHNAAGEPLMLDIAAATHIPPGFHIVGATASTERETRDRVRAAVLNSGFAWPELSLHVMATPAGLHAITPMHDLAIAVGVIAAAGGQRVVGECYGQLSLDGIVLDPDGHPLGVTLGESIGRLVEPAVLSVCA